MPSKVRFILMNRYGEVYTGARAVSTMQKLVVWKVLEDNYPVEWKKMTKLQKISWLAEKLPNQWKMIAIKEPARTRASRSKYQQLLRKIRTEGIPQEIAFVPLAAKKSIKGIKPTWSNGMVQWVYADGTVVPKSVLDTMTTAQLAKKPVPDDIMPWDEFPE